VADRAGEHAILVVREPSNNARSRRVIPDEFDCIGWIPRVIECSAGRRALCSAIGIADFLVKSVIFWV